MAIYKTLKELIQDFQSELNELRQTGEMPETLYDALYEFYLSAGEMPYGVAKARTGDPWQWITNRFNKDFKVD